MEGGLRLRVKEDLHQLRRLVVVRRDAQTRQVAVDHEVDVLLRGRCAARERTARVKQQVLQHPSRHQMPQKSKTIKRTAPSIIFKDSRIRKVSPNIYIIFEVGISILLYIESMTVFNQRSIQVDEDRFLYTFVVFKIDPVR